MIAVAPQDELADLERELAEDCAIATLESECLHRGDGWLDTSAYDTTDPEGAIRYLELRGLLERHPDNTDWVRIKESE